MTAPLPVARQATATRHIPHTADGREFPQEILPPGPPPQRILDEREEIRAENTRRVQSLD